MSPFFFGCDSHGRLTRISLQVRILSVPWMNLYLTDIVSQLSKWKQRASPMTLYPILQRLPQSCPQSSAETYQRGVWSMDLLSPRMSWSGAGSDLARQMMGRSWRATWYRLCSMVVTAYGDEPPCTFLPTTRALAATSRIGASPSRTIFSSTLPCLPQEKSSTGWRRTYASRKILNGIGFTVVEGLLSNQGMWPYVEWPFLCELKPSSFHRPCSA